MLEDLIAAVAQTLAPSGFARRGKTIKLISNGSAAIIEFQKSDKSSNRQIFFTINVGVVCGDLLDADRTDLNKATIVNAHLRDRLGMLLEPHGDVWWELTASTDCVALTQELTQLLTARAVPYLERYMSAGALISLWESGRSPGLTAIQRARFLAELKEKKHRTVS